VGAADRGCRHRLAGHAVALVDPVRLQARGRAAVALAGPLWYRVHFRHGWPLARGAPQRRRGPGLAVVYGSPSRSAGRPTRRRAQHRWHLRPCAFRSS
jgi:hypothetical protein